MDPTVTNSELTFEELRGIVAPIAAKHCAVRMYIFGSRARGDGDENSDYDFCIAVPKRFDLMDIGPLLGDLKDALGKKPILSAKTISIKGRTSWRKCYVTEGPYSRHDTEDLQAILKYCENIADIIWMSMSKE